MRKFLLIAAFAAPFMVSTVARADDDAKPAKTKKMHKSKKTKTKADGTTETKTTTEKTEKPAEAPANP